MHAAPPTPHSATPAEGATVGATAPGAHRPLAVLGGAPEAPPANRAPQGPLFPAGHSAPSQVGPGVDASREHRDAEQRAAQHRAGRRDAGAGSLSETAGRLPPPAAPSGRRGFPTKPEGSVFCVGKINGMMQTAVFMYKQMCVHQKAGASGKVPRPPTTTGTEAEVLDPPGPATQVCATWSTSAVPGLRVLRTLRALGVTSRPLRLHSAARRKRESVIPGGDATP